MKTINLIPGSPEWVRARSASKAPAMMGVSNYGTRDELIAEMVTGITEDIDKWTQARFDKGHLTETRSLEFAQEIIGDELSPKSASSDDGYLTANYDGITFSDDIAYEHKVWNKALAASVRAGVVPESHAWQLDQQILVGNLDYVLFVVSDGTKENFASIKYRPNKERADALLAGWHQLDIDVEEYRVKFLAGEIKPIKEKPIADAITDLPALFVQAKGEITAHNMEAFGESLKLSLANTRALVLITDQDYSNAEAAAKLYRETCKKLVLVKEAVLAQATTIGEATRMIDAWHEDLRVTALKLEKDVTEKKEAQKLAIITQARIAYIEHVTALELEIKPIKLNLDAPEFAASLKGKRLISAWHDAANTLLANSKIKADAAAKDVREKLAWLKESSSGFGFLFNDLAQIIAKPLDDFKLLVTSRIEAHKVAESEKLEVAREQMRVEEEAKAKAKVEAEVLAKFQADAAAQTVIDNKARAETDEAARLKRVQDDLDNAKAITAANKVMSVEKLAAVASLIADFAPAKESLVAAPTIEMVTIPKDEYESLKEDSEILDCLRACGVDNWEGWDDAMDMFHEDEGMEEAA